MHNDTAEAVLDCGETDTSKAHRLPVSDQTGEITAQPGGTAPVKQREESGPMRRHGRPLLFFAALLVAGGAGGHFTYDYVTYGRFIVSTDDAYVKTDLSVIAAKVPGYITAVPVRENTAVKTGDVLARIDGRDYRIAADAAERKINTQNATIARIEQQSNTQRAMIEQAKAQLAAAKADQPRAEADFRRASKLAASEFSSRKTLDQARSDRDRSLANVKSAEAGLAAAEGSLAVFEAQKNEAEQVLGELRTSLDKANLDLSYTTVTAPFDGTVGNKAAQPGQYVQPGTRLMALVPLSSAYVEANFKETQLRSIKPGQKVDITVDAADGHSIEGVVESIAPASGSEFSLLPPENATGNFTKIVQRVPVRIKVPAEAAQQGLLRAGLSVVVDVDTKEHSAANPPSGSTPASER